MTVKYSKLDEDDDYRPFTAWHLISLLCSCAIGWGLVWLIVFGISRAIDMHR